MDMQQWLDWNGGQAGFVTPQANTRPPQKKHPLGKAKGKRYKRHGFTSLPTKNYTYGACEPIGNLGLVNGQIYLAHKYRNQLVEIELAKRQAVGQAAAARDLRYPQVAMLVEEADGLKASIGELRQQIKDRNKAFRKRLPSGDLKLSIAAAKERLVTVWAALKLAKEQSKDDPQFKADCATIQDKATALAKERRQQITEAGLYWGTYICVERGVATNTDVRKWHAGFKPKVRTIKDLDGQEVQYETKPDDPSFRRFDGQGLLAVQKQTGSGANYLTPWEAHTGQSNLVRIEHVERKRVLVHLRIGTEQGQPLWAKIPVIMHRPLDPESYITWVKLLKRHIGTHTRWQIQFTLAKPAGWERPRPQTGVDVAVNLGWRWRPQGLRVAYWLDTAGGHGEILVPWKVVERYQSTYGLQSIRDNLFDAAKRELSQWLAGRDVPEWLREGTRNLASWRSPARLAKLVLSWRAQRFVGDEAIFKVLEQAPLGHQAGHGHYHAWRNQDRHLYDWQCFRRRKVENYRLDLFRRTARHWADAYGTIHIAEMDYAKLRTDPLPEEEPDEVSRCYRNLASPGLFAKTVRQAASGRVQVQEAAQLTATCHLCRRICQVDGKQLRHTCEHCGEAWDIDYNHCRNLLRREGEGGGNTAVGSDGSKGNAGNSLPAGQGSVASRTLQV